MVSHSLADPAFRWLLLHPLETPRYCPGSMNAPRSGLSFNQRRVFTALISLIGPWAASEVPVSDERQATLVFVASLLIASALCVPYMRWVNAKRPRPLAKGMAGGLGLLLLGAVAAAPPLIQVGVWGVVSGFLFVAALLAKDPQRTEPPRPDV